MIGAKDVDAMLDLSRVPPKCDMSRDVVCSPPVRISAGVTFHRLAFFLPPLLLACPFRTSDVNKRNVVSCGGIVKCVLSWR